jgi:hypothetical protein
VPAREKRILEQERQERMTRNAAGYVQNARKYRATMTLIDNSSEGSTDGG